MPFPDVSPHNGHVTEILNGVMSIGSILVVQLQINLQ